MIDQSSALAQRIATIAENGGGTLELHDGVHAVSRPLELPQSVSLVLSPGATLKALPRFEGSALVIKKAGPRGVHLPYGCIRGGTLDASALPITGILVEYACRFHIADLEIKNALLKGIHIGVEGWYEVNLSNLRVYLDMDQHHAPGSVGIHYDRCTDSLVNSVVVIGYETGLRSDSSSNDFHQVHVWNVPAQGPLKYCFDCNGWNDSYNQCYADSPFNGDDFCCGFIVRRPFNRITGSRVYLNQFTPDNRAVGIFLDAGGTHGTYIANHFTASDGHRMKAAIDGNLDSACVMGNSYSHTILAGRVCQIPSGGGGLSAMPGLQIVGDVPVKQPI